MAVQDLIGTNYHEALFLDAEGLIAEGPGENFFIVKGGKLITPPKGTILPGITRATVMELARKRGITVEEKQITPEEAFAADEAFFTGTAAEVTPIGTIDDHKIGTGKPGEITKVLKQGYLDVVYGRDRAYDHYLTYVSA